MGNSLSSSLRDPRPLLLAADPEAVSHNLMVWLNLATTPGPLDAEGMTLVSPQYPHDQKKLYRSAELAALLLNLGEYDASSGKIVVLPANVRRGAVDRLNGVASDAAKCITPHSRELLEKIYDSLPSATRDEISFGAVYGMLYFIAFRVAKHDAFDRLYAGNGGINAHLGVFYDNAALLLNVAKKELLEHDLSQDARPYFGMYAKLIATHAGLVDVSVQIFERHFTGEQWCVTMQAAILRRNVEACKLLGSDDIVKRVDAKFRSRVLTKDAGAVRVEWVAMAEQNPDLAFDWIDVGHFLDKTVKHNFAANFTSAFWKVMVERVLSKRSLSKAHRTHLLTKLPAEARNLLSKSLGAETAKLHEREEDGDDEDEGAPARKKAHAANDE